jgi:succinyl-CoA synthetase beta subunit
MKIHEYQAKQLLARYGVPVPAGVPADTPAEAAEAAKRWPACVVKAQVHSGGRGKAGGVKLARGPEEAAAVAAAMLGTRLYTKQAGPEGKLVRHLLVTEAVEVAREYYLAAAIDPENACLTLIGSRAGGTEIEEVAAGNPAAVVRVPVSATLGFRRYEGLELARLLEIPQSLQESFLAIAQAIARLMLEQDASLVEINPLAETKGGGLLALDAKINLDDNALFRHPELEALRDPDEQDPMEVRAGKYELNYIRLDGSIGCMVNGAGLAMATMDIIASFGGRPANFLDVGGGATAGRVEQAFEILLSDPNVKAIFVNIFGGIVRCDLLAQGIVQAAAKMALTVPLVVRLEGTHAAEGREILGQSGLAITAAGSMREGAERAVALAGEART